MEEEEQAPLLLPGTRPPTLWREAGLSLAFVAAGVWLIRTGEAGGWLALGFFGLCAVLALLVPLARRNLWGAETSSCSSPVLMQGTPSRSRRSTPPS
jgi:hypothetical protein